MAGQWLKQGGRGFFASSVLFFLPALALTTPFGMSLMQLVVLLAFLWFANKGLFKYFAENFYAIRWVVIGFAGYFIVNFIRMLLSSSTISTLDGPLRLLLALTCIGVVGWFRPNIRWFWLGLCVGALGAAIIALVDRYGYGIERVEGFTHHAITFGNLSLALGIMALCGWSEFRNTKLSFLPVLSVLCGVLASILSGSRGGWFALLLCVLLLLYYGRRVFGKGLVYAIPLVLAIFPLAYFAPGTGVQERIAVTVSDIESYFLYGDASTSLGIRFELWKASLLMFSDNPFLGVGRDQFHYTLQQLAQQGRLRQSPALAAGNAHSDPLHFLATGGLLDFTFLMLFYLAPLGIFISVLRGRHSGNRQAALAGLLLIVCFIGFGLTEAMFWLMAPKVFYSMMVCVLIGFCLMVHERSAEKTRTEKANPPSF